MKQSPQEKATLDSTAPSQQLTIQTLNYQPNYSQIYFRSQTPNRHHATTSSTNFLALSSRCLTFILTQHFLI